MTVRHVAGVDWAGGNWLVVDMQNGSYETTTLEPDFKTLWTHYSDYDRILIDIPIGLPTNSETLTDREALDSQARSVTGRPSSVFPAPSRKAAELALDDESYEKVSKQNQTDLEKGLSSQSYHIASAIGQVDATLRDNEDARETVIEAHPEVCFRGLLGQQLQYSKHTAPGLGERLDALETCIDAPAALLSDLLTDLRQALNSNSGVNKDGLHPSSVDIDDAVDAFALAVVGMGDEDFHYLGNEALDEEDIPMRMAYRSARPFDTY